ncbi:hypothetical protein NDU88_002545 [Pleurodeles waltl]|uniref:Uncharacterized protein n=1 Tax=Pleurodeles waltl TaxID=8319 RepID=A0AAV7WS04_PLEWA|nr:hypothetical protein NDU88_002545 [Pleurodeles waltl]
MVSVHSPAPNGRRHVGNGRETQHGELAYVNSKVMHEIEADDKVELDYDDDSDDLEEGEVCDAEVSKVVEGAKGGISGPNFSSFDLLQTYSADKGVTAGKRKEDCGRKLAYGPERGPNGKGEWWSTCEAPQSDIRQVQYRAVGVGVGQ